jgi:small subunit ribosomal protein S18
VKKGFGKTKYRSDYPVDFNFDYKDASTLARFAMEGGKIVPSRISKLSSNQQRAVAKEVKKARSIALLPIGSDAHDRFYAEPVSPKPFKFD